MIMMIILLTIIIDYCAIMYFKCFNLVKVVIISLVFFIATIESPITVITVITVIFVHENNCKVKSQYCQSLFMNE